jgi:diguanylate cyclase (GGDEF)-like protein
MAVCSGEAMEQVRSGQEELERLERALRTLSGCNRALLRARSEDALLREICRVVVEEAGYRMARIGRAEHDDDKTVTLLAQAGIPMEEAEMYSLRWNDSEHGHSATGLAIRTGRPQLVNDAQGEDFPPLWRDFSRRWGLGSVLSLPLRLDGEIFGALTIAAPEPDAFDGRERRILDEVADDLAFGLEILRLRQRREHAEAEVRHLNRALRVRAAVNLALAQAADETALLQEVCRVAVEECGYRLAWVGFLEHDAVLTLRPVAHAGLNDGFLSLRRHWKTSRLGRAMAAHMEAGEPMVLRDVVNNPDYPFRKDACERGYGSVVALPLRIEGTLAGSFHILASETDAFDDKEVQLLMATAADLGYGLAALRNRVKAAAAEETIRRMAYFDAVTRLPNQARLRELLEDAIATAREERRPLAFLRIGMAHLREVNEALGSGEVDRLVRAAAQRLQQVVGEAGRLGRLTEAEFAVLLPRAGAEAACRVAQLCIAALDEPVDISGFLLDARSSAGISLYPGHATDPEMLIRRAGSALTQARGAGAAVAVFKPGLDRESAQRMALMSELRGAIERDELMLYCQPKMKMASGAVCGAEALVRWNHPRLGQVNPGSFIKLAEQTGLITPLTFWMLDAALRQSHAWHELGQHAQPLSINLSARDLHDPRLLERIEHALATWGAEPDWIEFELTESALMHDPVAALETMTKLKRLDLRLAIDDYGTGYSSLSYLQRLPVDAIKIDQSFVAAMQHDDGSTAIVRSTIELAHSLHLEVVAEGVEDDATLQELAALHCDMAQGYCISRPLPADDFLGWCAARV